MIRAKIEEYNGERRSKYALRKAEKCDAKVQNKYQLDLLKKYSNLWLNF